MRLYLALSAYAVLAGLAWFTLTAQFRGVPLSVPVIVLMAGLGVSTWTRSRHIAPHD